MDVGLEKEIEEMFQGVEQRTQYITMLATDASLLFNQLLAQTGARELALMSALTFVKIMLEDDNG